MLASDGSGPRHARARARSPGSKARPELDFLGPDPSIGDGSGPRPARAWPRPDPSLIALQMQLLNGAFNLILKLKLSDFRQRNHFHRIDFTSALKS